MTTIEEALTWQNRHGIALVKAFGLDPALVCQDGIDLHGLDGGVTFRTLDGHRAFHGDDLTESQVAALREYRWPAPEPKRAATWRDVVRVMRAAGFKLKVEEREARYRKWWVDEGTGGIIAEIWRQTLGGRPTWTVEIYGYLSRRVRLEDPEPAAVLAAAMLTRIIDGPVCGVDVTGLAEMGEARA